MAKSRLLELQHIDPMSLGKILAVIYAIIGFFYGILIAAILPYQLGMFGAFGGMMAGFGVVIVIFMTIALAIAGLLIGIIGAWLYNVIAGRVGGVKLRLH